MVLIVYDTTQKDGDGTYTGGGGSGYSTVLLGNHHGVRGLA